MRTQRTYNLGWGKTCGFGFFKTLSHAKCVALQFADLGSTTFVYCDQTKRRVFTAKAK